MKKRQFIAKKNLVLLLLLIIILVICTYTNIKLKNSDRALILGEAQFVSNAINDKEDFFSQTRMEIEMGRDEKITHLKSLLESDKIDEKTKASARDEYFQITQSIENEKICEGLIRNKIKYDLMVVINYPQVNVTIKAPQISDLEITRIKDIIISQTDLTTESIKISLID